MKYLLLLIHIVLFALIFLVPHQSQVVVVSPTAIQQTEIATSSEEENSNCSVPPIMATADIKKWIEGHPTCSRSHIFQALAVKNVERDLAKTSTQNLYLEEFHFDLNDQLISILAVQDFAFSQIWYFVFRERGNIPLPENYQTGYIGYINFAYQRDFPNVQLITGEDTSWLTIKTEQGHGTGFLLCDENWFELMADKVKPVLSYPAYGYEGWITSLKNRTIKAVPISQERINGKTTIKVMFSALYDADPAFVIIQKQKAVFVRDKATGEFRFDESQSDLTLDEYKKVYNLGELDDESYIEYNFAAINKFVSNPSPDKSENERLRGYLRDLKDSPRAKALLAKLN